MPQITPVPKSQFTTSAERTSLGRESLDAQHPSTLQPSKGPAPSAIAQTPIISHSPVVPLRKLVKSIPGIRVGQRSAHNVDIFDLTADHTQWYPFLVHCNTCAFEGRLVNMSEAEGLALTHAGKS